MKVVPAFRLLLLGLWLGAAVFFIGVAQTAFAVLPTHELAGAIVSRTLAILNYSGLGIAFISLLMSLMSPASAGRISLWIDRTMVSIIGIACAVSQFIIISWMMFSVRAQMGRPIDEVPGDDPLKARFDALHQYSEWLMLLAMAAALIGFAVIAMRRPTVTGKKNVIDNLDFQKQFKI